MTGQKDHEKGVEAVAAKLRSPSTFPGDTATAVARELIDAYLKAILSPSSQTVGWQTMETAPTNGERVDIWLEPHDAEESGNAHRRTNAYFARGDWWFRANDGSKDVAASYQWRVTHWMLPPTAPTATPEGGE